MEGECMHARGRPKGDSARIRKNLLYVEQARSDGADVHIITNRMLSLLGLLVVRRPGEPDHASSGISLDDLKRQGWPRWHITLDEDGNGKTETLDVLLRHFRNALAHGRFYPDSDSREPSEVGVIFEDAPKGGPVYWRAHLGAVDLLAFCEHLADFIEKSTEN